MNFLWKPFKRFATLPPATAFLCLSLTGLFVVAAVLFFLDRESVDRQRKVINAYQAQQVGTAQVGIEDRIGCILAAERFLSGNVFCSGARSWDDSGMIGNMLLAMASGTPDVAGYFYLGSDGRVTKAFAAHPGAAGTEKLAAETAKAFLDGKSVSDREFPVTGPFDTASGSRYMPLVDQIREGGKTTGVLVTVIDVENIVSRYVAPIRSGPDGRTTLMDTSGLILYDRDPSLSGQMLSRTAAKHRPEIVALSERIARETSGTAEVRLPGDSGETCRLVAWAGIHLADRTLRLLMSTTDLQVNRSLSELRKNRNLLGVSLFLFICASAALLLRFRSLRDLRERKGELERIATDQDTLLEIFKFFGECVTVNDLYLVLNGSLASILKFRNFVIGLRTSRRGDDTVVIDSLGDVTASCQADFLASGKGIIGHVMRTGEPYNAGDLSVDPHYVPHNGEARSLLVVPVVYKQFQWGIIGIEGHLVNEFGERETRILGIVASYIALHMEEMEARRELDQRAGQFRFLNRFAREIAGERNSRALCTRVTKVLAHDLGFPWVGYYETSSDGGALRPEPAESQYAGDERQAGIADCRELAERAALLRLPRRESYSSGLVYKMAIPLQFGNTLYGVLCAVNERGFSGTDSDLFEITAEHMSTFLALNNLIERRRQEAMTDALTGVWNRRYIMRRLEEESGRPKSDDRPGCVAIADLGNFKGINDRYGHLVGDEVLRKTASALRDRLRDGDMIGRYGGDEFLFYLSGVSREEAEETMEDLAQVAVSVHVPGVALPVVLDWGIAFCPGDADNLLDVVRIADERMYQRKSERKRRQGE